MVLPEMRIGSTQKQTTQPEHNTPVLHDEWVFAFLPVQKTRFKVSGPLIDVRQDFLIEIPRSVSDSSGLCHTSQQTRYCRRFSQKREGLSRGIIDAFITAIKQMCKHPTLRFQWMRYLPKPDTIGSSWSYLIKQITKKIQDTRVMVPRSLQPSMDTLKLIEESAILGPRGLDSSGEPLLRDNDPGVYLSPAYQKADLLSPLRFRIAESQHTGNNCPGEVEPYADGLQD
ncbi:hypothetical protein PG994_008588 [Apiospora phragmitis]|uniref:Uncharacterized protein n=1 Tax=Apiospora phragmitis TaxID=2905665 RepID=A0ABR1UGW7_9PEZI